MRRLHVSTWISLQSWRMFRDDGQHRKSTDSTVDSSAKPALPPLDLPSLPPAYDWESFRRDGHDVIDSIVDYHKKLAARQFPAAGDTKPGFLREALGLGIDEGPPTEGVPFTNVIQDVEKHVHPGMVHWQHPDFFAFFPAQLSPPALLGELLASSMNQPGFNWMCSPAASELEIIVTDWITKAFDFPAAFLWSGSGGMVLQPTATESAIVAMVAARGRVVARHKDKTQLDSSRLVAYASDQAHFCVEKACRVLGVQFHKVATNRDDSGPWGSGNFPMTAKALEAAMEGDVARGLIPFFVSGNFGSTGICAVDPLDELGELCMTRGLWFNVDAAYAGVVAICPEMRGMLRGVEKADSVLINGHKWLSMIFNTAFMFFRDKTAIASALNATGEYLANQHQEAGAVIDFKDFHLGLGRPFRSLKVYAVIKCFGVSGLQAVIRRHVMLAERLAALLVVDRHQAAPSLLEVPVQPRFGLVCFRLRQQPNTKQMELLHALNATKRIFLVHALLDGAVILRIALAAPQLTCADIESVAQLVLKTAEIVMPK